MSENLNEIEKMQLAWMDMHPIQDKDGIIEEAKAEEEKKREQVKKFKPRQRGTSPNRNRR